MDSNKFSLSDFNNVKSDDLLEKMRQFSIFLHDVHIKGYDDAYLRKVTTPSSNTARIMDGISEREVIQMNSANYLGLASNPEVIAAAQSALSTYGVCNCAVPLIAGTTALHESLESKLSNFKQVDMVAMYQTGYTANMGTIAALLNPSDFVVIDKQVHYSIIDGVKLSGARLSSFRHSDMNHLRCVLERIRKDHKDSGILVVIEGVYGIDGDLAPLPEIVEISNQYSARIMIDDAHATGILGKNGAGLISHFGLDGKVDIIMDSLSKSLGSFGGYIGASKEVIEYLRYYSRPISFSVGLPAVMVAAALKSLELMTQSEGLVNTVRNNISYMKDNLISIGANNVEKSESAIMSMIIGDEVKLRAMNKELIEEGLWIEGIPYPAVPRGHERLRLRVNAAHTRENLDKATELIDQKLRKYRINSTTIYLNATRTTKHINQELTIKTVCDKDDLHKVAQLIWDNEADDDNCASWHTIDDRLIQLSGQNLYNQNNIQQCTFTGEVNGKLVATVSAFIDRRANLNTSKKLGFLGYMSFSKDFEEAGVHIVNEAIKYLSTNYAETIIAPVDVPMLIFGGGIMNSNDHKIKPAFQPLYQTHYKNVLSKQGFTSYMRKPYFLFTLKDLPSVNIVSKAGVVRIEKLNKLNWVEHISDVRYLINECFPKLEYFWGVQNDELEEYVRSFLDLLNPDFWLFAYVNDELAGFIGGFPANEKAIRETNGYIGNADFSDLESKYDKTKTGSITWLAVLPEFKGMRVGEILLSEVLTNFANSNYSVVTSTWELSDPDNTPLEIVTKLGGSLAGLEIEVMYNDLKA